MDDNDLLYTLKCVGLLSFNKNILSISNSFSIFFPLEFVYSQLHNVLWLLKSPTKMNGWGNWLIIFVNWSVSNSCLFGIYILHMVSFSFRCIVIAVASKIDVMFNISIR